MKNSSALLLFALMAMVVSCEKKSDPDVRDSFVGSWTWHYTIVCSATGSGNSPTTIEKSSSSSGVAISFGSIHLNGTVSGILLTIPLQTQGTTKYEGSITVSGGKLDIELGQIETNNTNPCSSTGLATKN